MPKCIKGMYMIFTTIGFLGAFQIVAGWWRPQPGRPAGGVVPIAP